MEECGVYMYMNGYINFAHVYIPMRARDGHDIIMHIAHLGLHIQANILVHINIGSSQALTSGLERHFLL